MALVDALLLEAYPLDVWFAVRTDGVKGSGTENDPYDASPRSAPPLSVTNLSYSDRVATATTGSDHGYLDGDVVTIAGVTGAGAGQFNGTFPIYDVGDDVPNKSFKYYMNALPGRAYEGSPTSAKVTFPFDDLMKAMAANTAVHLGPGVIQTRGYSSSVDAASWKPKSGQKIIGSGIGVTTLKIVYAAELNGQYYAIGMLYSEYVTDFEASDFTVDCNLPGQPVTRPYVTVFLMTTLVFERARLSCGAMVVNGSHIRIRRIRAINFGTQGVNLSISDPTTNPECFVILAGGGYPFGVGLNPESYDSVVEDCIIEKPGENNTRETTCIGMGGGEEGLSTGYMAYIRACVVRNCYVNCEFANGVSSKRIPVDNDKLTFGGGVVTLITRSPHHRTANDMVVVDGVFETDGGGNPMPSTFNGAFEIASVTPDNTLTYLVDGTHYAIHPTSNIFIGTHFQAFTVGGGTAGVIEGNHVSTTAFAVFQDTYSTKDLTVRDNFFTDVLVGVLEIMTIGNKPKAGQSLTWVLGIATLDAGFAHGLVTGDAVSITDADPDGYEGFFNVVVDPAFPNRFTFALASNPGGSATGFKFSTLWQEKHLVIENNVIELTASIDDYGEPTGIYCEGNRSVSPYNFRQLIVRENVIRHPVNVSDAPNYPVSRFLVLTSCENAIVENNVIDVESAVPILLRYFSTLKLFNNRTSTGKLLDGFIDATGQWRRDEAKEIEDSLVLSF